MIYIIDDDKYVRRGFGMLLKSADLECKCFGSAEDFLESCQPVEQDLLILDMHMPGMGGCDLLEHFIKEEIHVPVIIITAFDEPASRECAKNYGALAYLRKPVDGEALIDLIKYSVNSV
ncbi:MAG TPA: response regulator [Bacteroidales bacterium]|nr:response regulator [Bacteroidales bacterium]HNS45891.1 response regulator [Bacteroidales bacterium]